MKMSGLNTSASILNVFGVQHYCGGDNYVILSDGVQLCTLKKKSQVVQDILRTRWTSELLLLGLARMLDDPVSFFQ